MSDADALLLSIINLLGYDWWRQQHDARLDAWYEATLRYLRLVREIPPLDRTQAECEILPEPGGESFGIEITEEMVEAGFRVLVSSGMLDEPMEADKLWLAEIYRAMHAHSPLDVRPGKSAPIKDTTT